jgi:hypothetical protein
MSVTANRVVKEYVHRINARPEKVFPLLCPVREYEWIDGWTCDIVYSESGVAENNCVFKTSFPDRGEATWVVSKYDPKRFAVEFVIYHADRFIEKLDITLLENDDKVTSARWVRTFTGLSQEGNEFITNYVTEHLDDRMKRIEESLNHYCTTGEKLVVQ